MEPPRGANAKYKDRQGHFKAPHLSEGGHSNDVSVPAINQHLKRLFADSELEAEATIKKFLIVQYRIVQDRLYTSCHLAG